MGIAAAAAFAAFVGTGPSAAGPVVDVAVDGARVAVVEADGTVWMDDGDGFVEVLGPFGVASRGDRSGGLQAGEPSRGPQRLAGGNLSDAWDVSDDEEDDALPPPSRTTSSGTTSRGTAVTSPRLSLDADALWIARGDGLWRVEDGVVAHVLDGPVADVAARPAVVAVMDGEIVGPNGRPAAGPADVRRVFATDRAVLAAAADGLWTSADGVRWERLLFSLSPVLAAAVDGDDTFVATRTGVLVLGAKREKVALSHDVRGATDLAVVGPGHALAVAPDGVWETVDEGASWRLVDAPAAVAVDGDALVGPAGLYRATTSAGAEAWMPLSVLLEAVPEARRRPPALPAVLPTLVVEARRQPAVGVAYAEGEGTGIDASGDWTVSAWLTWTRPPAREDVPAVDPDDPSADRRAAVTSLWRERAGVVDLPAPTLLDATDRELRAEELEARLDALTDGAVTRWRTP